MANRRFIDFPIASSVGDNDIVLIWQDGLNKQTTKGTLIQGAPTSLEGLTDVDIAGLINGQILQYNSVTGKWENVDRTGLNLSELGDVSIVSPSNGQVLVYNSTTSKWENSSAGFVPYVGAVTTVDLGAQGLRAGYVRFNTSVVSVPNEQGLMYWDGDDETIAVILNGYIMKVGEDQFYPVKNQTGSSIAKGTAVRFAGTLGASGRLLIAPFIADGSVSSSFFMGVTAEAIANGADGKVLYFGRIRGINTNAFNEGDVLYASTTVAGGFQTAVPVAPNNIVQVAAVINKSINQGVIFIRPSFGSNINQDEGVKIVSPTTGQLLQLQANGLWENKTKAQVLGGTSSQFVKGDGSLDSTAYGTGTVTSVGLSSATSGVTIGSTPITTSGTITLAIATASGSQNGLLSSTDWTTFNGKQNALTNPVTGTGTTNYLSKFTGTSAIGNSQVFDDGTNVGIGNILPGKKLQISSSGEGLLRLERTGASARQWDINIKPNFVIGDNTAGQDRFFIDTLGNVGIGATPDASYKLDVNGTGRFVNGVNMATTSGNVGIGTNTPSAKLEIRGTKTTNEGQLYVIDSAAMAANTGGMITFGGRYNTAGEFTQACQISALKENATSGNASYALGFYTYLNGDSNLSERMRILSGGNVLISSANIPDSTADAGNLYVYTTGSPAANAGAKIMLGGIFTGSTKYGYASISGRNESGTPGNVSGYMTFATHNNIAGHIERMRITSDGNVGINQTNPTGRLEVVPENANGNEGIFVNQLGSRQSTIRFKSAHNADSDYRIGASILIGSAFEIFSVNAASTRFAVTSGGNVLIGTTSDNGSRLRVNGSVALPHVTKSANYTLDGTDYTVGFDCASNRTANLPDATTCAGRIYVIYQYNTNIGLRYVTIDGNGSQTINGLTTVNLQYQDDFSSVMIQSNGSNWVVIASALYAAPV